MRHIRQLRRFRWRPGLVLLALAQTLTISAFAQATAQSTGSGNAAKGITEGEYSHGGFRRLRRLAVVPNLPGKCRPGRPETATAAFMPADASDENISRYFSLEQTISFANNGAYLQPFANNNTGYYVSLPGTQLHLWSARRDEFYAARLQDPALSFRGTRIYDLPLAGRRPHYPGADRRLVCSPGLPGKYGQRRALLYGLGVKMNAMKRGRHLYRR